MISKQAASLFTGLLLTTLAPPLGADTHLPALATVTARQLTIFPNQFSVQLVNTETSELDPDLFELAESVLTEQGVTVTNKDGLKLYLQRIIPSPNGPRKPRVNLSLEGGNTGFDKAQVDLGLGISKKSPRPSASQAYGFIGRVEGTAGSIYWQVRIITSYAPDSNRLSDKRLIQEALADFGRTTVREIHE